MCGFVAARLLQNSFFFFFWFVTNVCLLRTKSLERAKKDALGGVCGLRGPEKNHCFANPFPGD